MLRHLHLVMLLQKFQILLTTKKLRYFIHSSILLTTSQHWLTLNFNSNLDGAGLSNNGGRPDLNLVVALDISGSMEDGFQDDNTEELDEDAFPNYDPSNSKLEIAKKSLLAIMSQLKVFMVRVIADYEAKRFLCVSGI